MAGHRTIIIGGGVGPMAGVALHAKIIENTLTGGLDQDHLEVHHYSRSDDIPDRTDFLLGRTRENPAEGMARTFALAARALGSEGTTGVGGIPCNTFHAPAIFGPFLEMAAERAPQIKILDMLEETVGLIRSFVPGARRIGILSTTGTRASLVFDMVLGQHGMEAVHIPRNDQDSLHDVIYNREWGLKALNPPTERAHDALLAFTRFLVSEGSHAIVLACTEIPLALTGLQYRGVPLVDPMIALARGLVREAAPEQLKPSRESLTPLF